MYGSLFHLRRAGNAEHIVRLLRKGVIQEKRFNEDICNKAKENEYLGPGGLLNILFCFYIAYLPGTELNFFLKGQWIKFASQEDAERRLKKEKHEARETNDPSYRALGIDHHQQNEHDGCQRKTDDPGELLLCGAHIFGDVITDDQPAGDQCRGISRIDKNANEKIGQEEDDDILDQQEVFFEQDQHQRKEHYHKEQSR